MLDYVLQRLKEPSTWRGLIGILTAVGVVLSPDQVEAIIAGGVGLIGLINVFRREAPSAGGTATPPAADQAGFFRLRGLLAVAALALLTAFAFHAGGCSSVKPAVTQQRTAESVTVKALGALSVTIKESKGIVDGLYAAGKIKSAGYNRFAELRKKAWLSFLVADDAAQAALTAAQAPDSYPAYTRALADLLAAKADVDNMLIEFGVLPKPVEVP